MDELDGGGEVDVSGAGVAAHAGRGERQQRPQPLAAGIDQMPRQVGDQIHGARQPLVDQRVGGAHVRSHQGMQPLHRRDVGLRAPDLGCEGHVLRGFGLQRRH